jgi:hypothetical protein
MQSLITGREVEVVSCTSYYPIAFNKLSLLISLPTYEVPNPLVP